MAHAVFPWWLGRLLLNPVRRWLQDPRRILAPFVEKGMRVLELGPGPGFFTLELAERVGEKGKVFAVDIQEQMIRGLCRRVEKAGLIARVDPRVCNEQTLGVSDLAGSIDFALVFAVLHETPDPERVLLEIRETLVPEGLLLLAEPKGHVRIQQFRRLVESAERNGFQLEDFPNIPRCHAVRFSWRGGGGTGAIKDS